NTELKSEAVEAWVEVKKFSKHLFEEVSQGIQNISKKKKNRKEKKLSSSAIWIISLVAVLILLITSPLLVLILAIGGYIIYRKTTKESEKKGTKSSQAKKEKKNEKEWTSALRVMVSVLFNLFFFVWFWIALFFVIVGLFITSIALMIAGLAIVIFSLFALISYATELIRSLLLSSLFSGAGVFILGGMFFWLSKTLANAFFSLTKGYVRLNRRFIRK
ncbi:MAG: DUF1700 domain-containing protein, partial [Nanoarchaeota archaeon]|nr:DUF1700 domain-containing protein [Nanoarchaeota archaeon]